MLKKYQKVLFSIFLLYSFLGFFLFPYLLKSQIQIAIEENTNTKVNINNVSFNPFIFKLTLSGLELKSLDNEHMFTFDSLSANLELYSLFNATIHLKELLLQKPKIFLVQHKDKSINLLSVLKDTSVEQEEFKEPEEASKSLRVKLDKIKVIDGSLAYEDYTRENKFDFIFERIGFELKDVDTNDLNASDAKIRFYSALGDGGFIDIKSDILGFKPFVLEGSIDFEASKLYTQWRYLQDALNLEVADGKLSFHTNYYFNTQDINSTHLSDMRLHLKDLRVKPKEQYKDVLTLKSFDLLGIDIKPIKQELEVKSINLDSLYLMALRNKNGEIDWVKFLEHDFTNSSDSKEELTNSKPWDVLIKSVKLRNIQAEFLDKRISPEVKTQLNSLNIYAQNITLEGLKPWNYQVDMRLNDSFECQIDGSLQHKTLDLSAKLGCRDFNLVHYRPYIDDLAKKSLQKYDVHLLSSNIGFDSNLQLQEIGTQIAFKAQDTNLRLENFYVNQKSTNKEILKLEALALEDLNVDTSIKDINISNIAFDGIEIHIEKFKNMQLNINELLVPKMQKKIKEKAKDEQEYRVRLKHLGVNNAKVTFLDKSLNPATRHKLDKITLNAYGIDSQKNSWLKYSFSSRVNGGGSIKSKGSIRHTPLKQKGSFNIAHLSLKEFNPYIQDQAFVELDDGYFHLNAKTVYSPSKRTKDLRVEGSMRIEELFLEDSRNNSSLLSFNELAFKSFVFELAPNRFYVNEANLDAFYVDALIDEEKQMNFASLLKGEKSKELESKKKANSNDEFPFRITKLGVHSGSAKFADYSIPIKFQTDIHNLNGNIYAISNQKDETSYIDIDGEIDKYGATSIKGSFNSDPKKFTQIDLSFQNLNLNAMSGYSASFAGHEIDTGKLFLDLQYDIENSNLKGENRVVIKNIELGDEYEDENTTSLPLGFVIALLEDNDGVIDIDMPVDGDLDKPDFKYGELIFNTLGNLIVKAVTSPFAFLGKMLGIDTDELGSLDFEAGKIAIRPPEREKLDTIAKMMHQRPKLSLMVYGAYDKVIDKEALQLEKLITLSIKKSGTENRENHESVMNIDLLEDIYKDFKGDDKLDEIEERLEEKYEDEAYDRAYKKALIKETMSLQEISLEEMKLLGHKRAELIKNYLVQEKRIEKSRIVLENIIRSEYDEVKLVHVKLEVGVK